MMRACTRCGGGGPRLDAKELSLVVTKLHLYMTAEEVQGEMDKASSAAGSASIDYAVFQAWWQAHESSKWFSTMKFFVLFLL